jgi:hypothetical protein
MTALATRSVELLQPWRTLPKLAALYLATALLGTAGLVAVRPHLPPATSEQAPAGDSLLKIDYVSPTLTTAPPFSLPPKEKPGVNDTPMADATKAAPEATAFVAAPTAVPSRDAAKSAEAAVGRSVEPVEAQFGQARTLQSARASIKRLVVTIGPYRSRHSANEDVSFVSKVYGLPVDVKRKAPSGYFLSIRDVDQGVSERLKRVLGDRMKVHVFVEQSPAAPSQSPNGKASAIGRAVSPSSTFNAGTSIGGSGAASAGPVGIGAAVGARH